MIHALLRRLRGFLPAAQAPDAHFRLDGAAIDDLMTQLRRLLSSPDAGQLAHLDDLMHRSESPFNWIRVDDLPTLLNRSDDASALLRALTAHSSGYIRESALRELAHRNESDLLRFLILRSNDWVEPISQFASAEAAARMRSIDLATLADSFPLLVLLAGQARRDHSALLEIARARLRSDCGEALIQASGKWSNRSRRAAFSWVLPSVDDPNAFALERALIDRDPVTRIAAVHRLAEVPTATAIARLEQLVKRSHGIVRATALSQLGTRELQRTQPLLSAALIDSSRAVREVARTISRTCQPEFDLRAHYVAGCMISEPAVGAIRGLAEVGDRSDADWVRPLLPSSRVAVRKAALETFVDLKRGRTIPECLAALSDPSPGVVRIAAVALERQRADLDYDHLVSCLLDLRSAHARQRCMGLIGHGPKWAVLPILLSLTNDASETIRESAFAHLNEWCARSNRRFIPPTPIELMASCIAFERAAPSMPRPLADELGFALRAASHLPTSEFRG